MRGDMVSQKGLSALEQTQLGSLLADIQTGWSPACDALPPAPDEWGVVRVSAVTSGRFIENESKRLPAGLRERPELEIRPGDVLMARANGARALVGATCYVESTRPNLMLSDKTLRLVVNADVADPQFLVTLLTSLNVRRQISNLLNGSSGQNNISQEDVWALGIPAVPLVEQRHIVSVYAAFEHKIVALERLLSKLRVAEEAVICNAMTETSGRLALGSLLSGIEAGRSPLAEDIPAGDGEWGVLKVSAVQGGWFKGAENKVVRDHGLINPRYEVRSGDLIMTRANTEQLVGLACVAHHPQARLMLSDKTLRLVPDPRVADASFIELALLSSDVRKQVQASATGTSGSMKNIGQAAVRQLLVPDVPVEKQRQLVSIVGASRTWAGKLRRQIAKLRAIQQGAVEGLLSGKAKISEIGLG
jgi:restriction endonuclease S subunit